MGLDTVLKPEKSVSVGSTAILTVNFVDDTGAPASPVSATWSLFNFLDGSVINDERNVALSISPCAASAQVVLAPGDNPVVDPTLLLEEHRLLVRYAYGDGTRIGKVEVQVVVENSVTS